MKITYVTWFSTPHAHTIGIVIGEDDITGEQKAYIGLGDGVDEEADTKKISERGASFPIETAKQLILRKGK